MQRVDSKALQAAIADARRTLDRVAAVAGVDIPRRAGSEPLALAERLYRERRARDAAFPPGLFGEPVWDMLLALFIAGQQGHRLTSTQAMEAAGTSHSTAGRVFAKLTEANLIVRIADPTHGRRIFVELTEQGRDHMADYLAGLL